MNCCTRAHAHVFCITELHNFNEVFSCFLGSQACKKKRKCNILRHRCQIQVLFFQLFCARFWEYQIINAHTELREHSVLWSQYVWSTILGFFIINSKHQEAVSHVLLSYLLSSFPALLLSPQIAWVISPPNSLPLAVSKGSFIHTVPLAFHSIKTLPVLWFFKQAWVSKVPEREKKIQHNFTPLNLYNYTPTYVLGCLKLSGVVGKFLAICWIAKTHLGWIAQLCLSHFQWQPSLSQSESCTGVWLQSCVCFH